MRKALFHFVFFWFQDISPNKCDLFTHIIQDFFPDNGDIVWQPRAGELILKGNGKIVHCITVINAIYPESWL